MKIMKLLKRDIALGTIRNWFKFLVVILVVIVYSHFLALMIRSGVENGGFYNNGTVMDYLLYVTQGMEVFHFSPEKYFSIPIYWFVFQIGISYMIAYYPEKDFKNFGKKIFLSSGSRLKWWISKCIWGAFNVVLYFAVLILAVMGIAKLHGAEMSWIFTEEIMTRFFGSNMQYVNGQDVWLIAIILPCLMTIALSLLQIFLSFILTPVVSFAMMCGIYIVSAYYTSWVLPGNYTMWLRSSYVGMEGINPQSGILIAAFIIVASIFAGCIYFEKCDIF